MTGKSPVQTSCVADLDGLEVEVVVQMQVVEILAMDEEVQHVVTLATHLQPNLDPVQHSCLEELGCLEGPEQIPEKKKKKDHCQQLVALKDQTNTSEKEKKPSLSIPLKPTGPHQHLAITKNSDKNQHHNELTATITTRIYYQI